MVKTFEKQGETYIVSAGAEDVDVETLTDKSILQKVMERVEKATVSLDSKTTPNVKNYEDIPIMISLLIKYANKNSFIITGELQKYSYGRDSKYEILLPIHDFVKLPLCLHTNKTVFVESITINWKKEMQISDPDIRYSIVNFVSEKPKGKYVRCWIELTN